MTDKRYILQNAEGQYWHGARYTSGRRGQSVWRDRKRFFSSITGLATSVFIRKNNGVTTVERLSEACKNHGWKVYEMDMSESGGLKEVNMKEL